MEKVELPSKYLSNAVDEFSKLPGIGNKTALRLILHLLRQDKEQAKALGISILELVDKVKQCSICHNISDFDVCEICRDTKRNKSLVCVVESLKDVLAIEKTRQFFGTYHVLGGKISPMDGIGPKDLNIESLENRIKNGEIKELIFALSTTMEGDATNYYLLKRFAVFDVMMTTLARGIAIGDDLEYIDELTLGRSIVNRIEYKI